MRGQFEASPLTDSALAYLGGEISRLVWNATQKQFDPTNNAADVFECETLAMRAFCWCDGGREGHDPDCPPNFEYQEIHIDWYKYLGRDTVSNVFVTPYRLNQVLNDCLQALYAMSAEQIAAAAELEVFE